MHKLLTTLAWSLIVIIAAAQTNKVDSLKNLLNGDLSDIERASTLQSLGPRFINTDPDSALLLAEQAFAITSNLDDYEMHSRSYRRMGHALYVKSDWNRFRTFLLSYVDFAEEHEDYFQVAASYRNLSKIGEATKQPDSSLYYLDKCIEVLAEHPDSVILIDVFLSKGLTYKYKGYYEMSIEALLQSARIAEAIKSTRKLGYIDMNLGITYSTMGRDEESARRFRMSIEHFQADGNERGETRSTSNLGFALKSLNKYDEAIAAFNKAIELAAKTKMENIAMHSHFGLADIAFEKGSYKESLEHVLQAETIAIEIGNNFTLGAAMRIKGKIALKENNTALAQSYIRKAEELENTHREPIEENEVYFEMAELYEGVGQYKKALAKTQAGHNLKDSVYTLKKEQQFAELNLIYETEKKDAQIVILNQNAEIADVKRKSLIGGLFALAGFALLSIFGLVQRNKKKQAILAQEKAVAIERQEKAERELEFKKKELLAKALQLANKNEFLQKLEEEVTALKSSVDDTVNRTSRRISRMIHQDTADDDEWSQFSEEFSSIHQGFLDELISRYGKLSQSELRLASLLKMNLTSKDIANILRISDEGIKKARYRLRKKMGLESGDDLQGILIAI